jgi:hypothetical protein
MIDFRGSIIALANLCYKLAVGDSRSKIRKARWKKVTNVISNHGESCSPCGSGPHGHSGVPAQPIQSILIQFRPTDTISKEA